jgi:hypothetical protein
MLEDYLDILENKVAGADQGTQAAYHGCDCLFCVAL